MRWNNFLAMCSVLSCYYCEVARQPSVNPESHCAWNNHFYSPWPSLSLWQSGPWCLNQFSEELCWHYWCGVRLVYSISSIRVDGPYSLVKSPKGLLWVPDYSLLICSPWGISELTHSFKVHESLVFQMNPALCQVSLIINAGCSKILKTQRDTNDYPSWSLD